MLAPKPLDTIKSPQKQIRLGVVAMVLLLTKARVKVVVKKKMFRQKKRLPIILVKVNLR